VVGDDLGEFRLDVFGVGGLSTDSSESSGSSIDSALLDEPSRGFGEEEESDSEDQADHQLRFGLKMEKIETHAQRNWTPMGIR
jgi:hypothetical protein